MKKEKMTWCIYALFVMLLGGMALQPLNARTAQTEEEIHTKGGWDADRRSLIVPVAATINGDLLKVFFRYPSPDVTITVTKGNEVVEQVTLSTTAMYSEFINLSAYGSGEYSLDVSDLRGNHIWGDFTIE